MEKKEIEINGHKIIIMEQPASFILGLEKKYGDFNLVGYAKEILKYPSGVNPKLEEIINIPTEIKFKELSYTMPTDKTNAMYDMAYLFKAGANKTDVCFAMVGEAYVQKLNKHVDDYKYKELEEMGIEVFKQVMQYVLIQQIIATFRNF